MFRFDTRLLQGLLAPEVARCGAQLSGELESIWVEATGDEVVDVGVSASNPALAACLTEAAWEIRLPTVFDSHRTYRVPLR